MSKLSGELIVTMTQEQLKQLVVDAVKMATGVREQKPYLTEDEVAEMLGVHKQTVRNYVKQRGLPAIRLSEREVRFERGALLDWIDSHRKAS